MADVAHSEADNAPSAQRAAPAALVCAWCGVPIVRAQAKGAVVSTSHGLCAPCARRLARTDRR
jgi:hypothetical protein